MVHPIRFSVFGLGFCLLACSPASPPEDPSAVVVNEPAQSAAPGASTDLVDDSPAPPPDPATLAKQLKCEQREDAWGCVDNNGAVVVPFEYLSISPFSDAGIAAVLHVEHGPQYIDATGKFLYEAFNFENFPDELSEGRARFVQNGKIGFVDESFEIAIPARYDSAMSFDGGKARVCVGCDPRIWSKDAPDGLATGRVFFIDRDGNEVPSPK